MSSKTENSDVVTESNTGWGILAGRETLIKMVDTLLNMPPHREFNKSELAELAGVSRKSVHEHFDVLEQLDLITPVDGTTPQRYTFAADSEVAEALIQLDAAVNNSGPHA